MNSMTGFGSFEAADEHLAITVEIKSVNHRYLDINVRMPRKLGSFEPLVRAVVKEHVSRGKVDISIEYSVRSQSRSRVSCDMALAADYLKKIRMMQGKLGIRDPAIKRRCGDPPSDMVFPAAATERFIEEYTTFAIARMPEVLKLEDATEAGECVGELLEQAVKAACGRLAGARRTEGESIAQDLKKKLSNIRGGIKKIEERAPQILEEYKHRLRAELDEMLLENTIDESRIAAEMLLFADRICTDEEIVRLRSHTESMSDAIDEDGEIGRKLDFVAQEMNREANTILSKANDLATAQTAIDLKSEIEKIREQIQNVE